ncbi:MAG: PAS domain S-box protein, partial [Desulfobulbaceae bacterium]|nr:PAS domain S-box protein [Desulfobulbaceae bacterium]
MKKNIAGNIRQRLAIAFCALAIGPIFSAGAIIIFHNYRLHINNALEHQQEVTLRVASHLAGLFDKIGDNLSWVNRFHNFLDQSRQRQYQFLAEIGADRRTFRQLLYLDAKGEVRAAVSNLQVETNLASRRWSSDESFLVPRDTGENYYSTVFFDESHGEPIMFISVPFRELRSGVVAGVLIAEINVEPVWSIISNLQLQSGEDIYLVDENKFVIAHANPSTVLSKTIFRPESGTEIVQTGLSGSKAVIAFRDLKVGNRTFTIVGERRLAQALRPALESAAIIAFILVIGLFAALCLALLAVKQIIIPIQKLTSTAKEIKAGNISKRVEIEDKNELGELAQIFNAMTEGLEKSLQTLSQSEERIRILVETIPHGIRECDLDGIITFTNSAHDRILEKSKDEMLGHPSFDLLTGVVLESNRTSFQKVLSEKQAPSSTYFIAVETGKGKTRDLAVNWDHRLDHKGKIQGYIFIITDVTERVKAEKSLKESEARFREFVEGTDNLVLQMDDEYQITYINGQAGKVLGLSDKGLDNISVFAVIHPDEREITREQFRRLIANRLDSAIFENRVVNLINREEHDVLWTINLHYDQQGKVTTINSIGSDITRRKAIEKELELSNRSMEALYQISKMKYESEADVFDFALETGVNVTDSAVGYIFLMSEDEKQLVLQSWSGEVKKQCGVSGDSPRYDVDKTGLWGEAVRQRKAIITNNYNDSSPYKKGLPTGHIPIHNHMNIPIFENERIVLVAGVGNKAGFYTEVDVRQLSLIMSDMWRLVQRKRNEEETGKLQERLNHTQKLEALGTLAGGIAHDFNNILGAMLGYTELSLIEVPKNGTLADNLAEVIRAGKRAKRLVDQILAFSRQDVLEKQPVRLDLVVKEAMNLLRSTMPTTIEFKENIIDSKDFVLAEPTQLHQIMMNLCTNAYHAMRDLGGVLDIELTEIDVGERES